MFTATRVLIAPSVAEEAWGRVAQEALVNGVPPIVSDRGGLAEACAGAGFVVPLPPELTIETAVPVDAAAVTKWVELVTKLADDEEHYRTCSARAEEMGRIYLPQSLTPRYLEFFDGVERAATPLA